MTKKNDFWTHLVLVMVSIFLALVLLEILGSYLPRRASSRREIQVDNEEFHYTAHLNSDHFRDEEFSKEEKPGVKRIFLIGDSFVFGTGVSDEHTLDKYLEWELKAAGAGEVEVWNLGLPDANVRDYFQLARYFRRYHPDLVIVSFYVDNDISERADGYWRTSSLDRLFNKIGNTFKKWAYAKGWARCRAYWNLPYDLTNPYHRLACEGKINPALIPRFVVGSNQAYYRRLAERFAADPFTRKYLKKTHDLFGEVPFLLLIFPSKYQVTTKDFPLLQKLGFPKNETDLTGRELQEVLLVWAKENGIAAVDPLPELRAAADQALYHAIDDHPDRTGNRLVARILAQAILAPGPETHP